jgi:Glu-tRNA(Gln) amidotransferase subunit E-like FAD-binding protein
LGSIVSGDVGSSQNKNLLIYIKNLLRDYIKERYKGKESDVYLINKELIKKFRDDFSDFINQYQEAVDTNIDLEAIIKKETEKVDKKIVAEIKSIITTVLKRKLKEHIKNNTAGKKTKEIREIINNYNLRDLNSVEIENIINRTLTNDHVIIK